MTVTNDLSHLINQPALFRAGGTDLQERLRTHPTDMPIVDLAPFTELAQISGSKETGLRIGAMNRITAVANNPLLTHSYPGFTQAAAELATPQIRNVATVGGNLLQHNRCWYYRHPQFSCFKKGGDSCPARTGNYQYGACLDLGDCIAVHPSTLAVAALIYDAKIEINLSEQRPLASLYGDGTHNQDHLLQPNELLTALILPPIPPSTFTFYQRAISRASAEWPLVELSLRLSHTDGIITDLAIAVGSIANIPLRLTDLEQFLLHKTLSPQLATQTAAFIPQTMRSPLPQTNYKLKLLSGLLLTALEGAYQTTSLPDN